MTNTQTQEKKVGQLYILLEKGNPLLSQKRKKNLAKNEVRVVSVTGILKEDLNIYLQV